MTSSTTGVAGHNVAGGFGIEVPQGQRLHFREKVIADFLLDALGHGHHQIALQEGGTNAHQEDQSHLQQEFYNGSKIGRTATHHRQNVIIHQSTQHHSAAALHQGVGQNTDQHHQDVKFVLQHIFQQPQKCLFGILGLATVTHHSGRCHYASRPFSWE